MVKVEYISNNSGGNWWLSDNDWYNLEKAGWEVEWEEERRLEALAIKASKEFESLEQGIDEWEEITGENSADEGCECCGIPHRFYEREL